MPLILAPEAYVRWLDDDSDPADLLRPFPAEPFLMAFHALVFFDERHSPALSLKRMHNGG
jgi:putative SOS response-associated peptidase YedK